MKYTIIGGGIGGLTTALAFEKKGIEYQLFEKTPSLKEVGAGIWLALNALQVFDFLDVLDQIKLKGNSIDRITVGEANLAPLSDIFQEAVKEKFGYSTIAIHRAELQKLLFEKLNLDNIHLGKEFKSFKELSSGKIKITFEDQSNTETDFLIAADGINSKVRKQLFPESTIRFSGQTCWRGLADIQVDSDFESRGMELWGNQIRFGLSKIAENKVYWFAVALAEANGKDERPLVQEKLLKMFDEFHPFIKNLISSTSTDKIIRNDINDLKPMKNWFKGNICLIGDAGHATTPNMGQGAAQAIEDAYYLCHAIEQKKDTTAFELFQQKRQKKVNEIVNQSWTTGKIAHWKYGKSLRNFMMKNMPSKMMEKKMMEMYEIEKYHS